MEINRLVVKHGVAPATSPADYGTTVIGDAAVHNRNGRKPCSSGLEQRWWLLSTAGPAVPAPYHSGMSPVPSPP